MSAALAIWRREVAGYFYAPIAYVVGVLFLAIQGLSFWALVESLSDPAQPAPIGAVLSGFFGGNLLYWSVLFAVVAVIAMRLVAEERRAGTWELMLTTRVEARAVLVGKWLGAVTFYLLLWAPTLSYLVVLAVYAPPGVGFDAGPIASAYLGVALAGAGFLGLGIAASSATANQIVAAVVTFAALFALLVAGQLGELAPSWVAGSPRLAEVVAWIDLRDHMGRFAAGAVDLGPIAFYLGLAAAGLALAAALVALGRRRRGEIHARLLAAGLVAVIVVLGNIIVARHPSRWDVTASGANSLRPTTRAVLDHLDRPVELEMIPAADPAYRALWRYADRLADRMVARQPLMSRRDSDLSLDPERAASIARELDVAARDLEDQGAIIVRHEGRARVIDLADAAATGDEGGAAPRVEHLHLEADLADAIVEVTAGGRPIVCATSGHGELEPTATAGSPVPTWAPLAARLAIEGFAIEDVGVVAGGVPAHCRALVVFGPMTPLSPDEALAVSSYLDGGGGLVLATLAALDPTAREPELPVTGLELVLEGYDIGLFQAIATDPSPDVAVDRLPGGFRVTDGYGDHPITRGFAGRRLTVWQLPRALDVKSGATALVETSPAGWGETDLVTVGATTAADPDDLRGPIAIAAASERQGRVVVFGSARSLSSELELGAGDALAARAVSWVSRRDAELDVAERVPEQVALVMTPGERTRVFVLCVVIIPLVFAGAGGIAWRVRRRA